MKTNIVVCYSLCKSFYKECYYSQTLTKNVIAAASIKCSGKMSTTRLPQILSLGRILTRKLTKIAKISYQSLIEVFKCFQRHWSSVIPRKTEKIRILGKILKNKDFLGTGKIIRVFRATNMPILLAQEQGQSYIKSKL